MAAAPVTGQDLRRVLEPREQQVLVMLMRNGDDEHSRRHAAQALRLGVDEVDALLASARRKVEQTRLRKLAQLDDGSPVRPVEEALLDAARHGGNGRAAGEAATPVGLRSRALARPPRLERDDDEEAKVTTTTRRPPGAWDRIYGEAQRLIRDAGAEGIWQRDLADELDISATEFSLNLAPRLKRDDEFERVQVTTGKPVTWVVAGVRESAVAVGGDPPALSSAAEADALADVADRDPATREARDRLARRMDEEDETFADPVGIGAAESAGVVSDAVSAHETSPPPERAGGDSAGGESDGRNLASRNGGDAPEGAAGTAPDAPLSETPPAHTDAEFMPSACAACDQPIGAQDVSVAVEGDERVWHSGCVPALPVRLRRPATPSRPDEHVDIPLPPPFAGGVMDTSGPKPPPEVVAALTKMLTARSAQPERSPRERYIDVLVGKLDAVRSREDAVGSQVDEVELMDRIERQLDALDG